MQFSLKIFDSHLKNVTHSQHSHLTNLKFISADIQDKTALINSIIQKYHLQMTYHKTNLSNSFQNLGNTFMDVSLKSMNEAKKYMIRSELNSIGVRMEVSPPIQVSWFPINFSDVNLLGKTLFQEQNQFNQDHPQFKDPVYRKRRDQIAQIAQTYQIQNQIPNIDYTKDENTLWQLILKGLRPLHRKHFSQRFQYQLQKLNLQFNIQNKIPQLSELSQYLNSKTGWTIKPVHGIISQRQFLNALAFKVFLSTQYLRHHATPHYTPQPDIVHEIIGHIPMFADKDIAELSQKIGLISLGASDEEIKKLGAIYFFTIQFGVCKQNGERKAYGAGFASCIKEIENLLNPDTKFKEFEPKRDCVNSFTTQQLQSLYYVTESFEEAVREIQSYGQQVGKPFKAKYNAKTRSIECNRNISIFENSNEN